MPILLIGSLSLSSCAPKLSTDDTLAVNSGVDYLWVSGDSVGIRPGMKLVIHALPLRGPHLNDAPPALTAYEWMVPAPGAPLDRKDVLFANYLAISGQPTGPVSASVEADLASRAGNLCANHACRDEVIGRKYVDDVLMPLFSTLRVRYFHRWTHPATDDTVVTLRHKACEPSANVLNNSWDTNTAPTGALVYSYTLKSQTAEYEVLGSGDWFLRGARGDLTPNPQASDWYLSNGVGYTRGFTEIQIPVRVGAAATSIYLPVCTSVAEAERKIGQPVVGVRRSIVFIPKDTHGNPRLNPTVRDGYFTIWLDGRETVEGMRGSPDLKPLLMLGAGDVLVMGYSRSWPSDAPTPSWQQR
jgi:hypothetical protein